MVVEGRRRKSRKRRDRRGWEAGEEGNGESVAGTSACLGVTCRYGWLRYTGGHQGRVGRAFAATLWCLDPTLRATEAWRGFVGGDRQ